MVRHSLEIVNIDFCGKHNKNKRNFIISTITKIIIKIKKIKIIIIIIIIYYDCFIYLLVFIIIDIIY